MPALPNSRFPAFEDILSPDGRRILYGDANDDETLGPGQHAVAWPHVLDKSVAAHCLELIDHYFSRLTPIQISPIPDADRYDRDLPYTGRSSPLLRLRDTGAPWHDIARDTGLLSMLDGDEIRTLAETATGLKLRADGATLNLCRYLPGDYLGPHHDRHDGWPAGRAVVVIGLSRDVQQQLYVYERGDYLSGVLDVSGAAVVTIARIPAWHYTTPLVPRPGRDARAVRWFIAAAFPLLGSNDVGPGDTSEAGKQA